METDASTATNKISHVDFSKQFEMYPKNENKKSSRLKRLHFPQHTTHKHSLS